MKDLLRKTMLMAIGLASFTREKIEEVAGELVKRGEMSEKEGRDFIDELTAKSKELKKDLESRTEKAVNDALKRVNVPSRQEIEELKSRIAVLEEEYLQRLHNQKDVVG